MVTQHNIRHRADPFDDLTFISSHEIGEAATDPTVLGWYADGFDEITEVADLCSEETARIPATVELGDASVAESYLVVRQYSEQAAEKESVNPCLPTPAGEPYFNGAIAPMTVTLDGQGAETGMGTLQLFSYSGDVGPLTWSVDVPYDRSHFTISPGTGSNHAGESVAIKVTSMGAIHEAHAGRIIGRDANGVVNEWWFPVSVQ